GLRSGKGHASGRAGDPTGRSDRRQSGRPIELGPQVGGEVDLVAVEKAPGRATHCAVEDGGHHAAMDDPAFAGGKRVIAIRFPFEDSAPGLELRAAPAKRIPDSRLARSRLLPRVHLSEALAGAKAAAGGRHAPERVRSCSTRTRRRIFPEGLLGIWLTTSSCRIFLYGATCWFTNAISSSGVTAPLSTTSAF